MHRRDTKPLRPKPPDARAATAPPTPGAQGSVCSPKRPQAPPPCWRMRFGEVFDRLRVDQDTGERRRIYSKHVREALAEMGNWPASVVERDRR